MLAKKPHKSSSYDLPTYIMLYLQCMSLVRDTHVPPEGGTNVHVMHARDSIIIKKRDLRASS